MLDAFLNKSCGDQIQSMPFGGDGLSEAEDPKCISSIRGRVRTGSKISITNGRGGRGGAPPKKNMLGGAVPPKL